MKRFKSSAEGISTQVKTSQKIEFKEFKISNGIQCYLYKDNFNPIINLSIGYKVGSKDETPNKRGLAHFFEHMMFEGSDHVKDKEHFKIISEAGGTMNGNTERDKTTYF